ncbi:MAG: ligase-associated DNA damage response endonuclease PdeM, partial [Gemmatimonadaceae bacterium]
MARLREERIEVAGEAMIARADRSLYWPREQLLIIADLHIGKSESLRQRGLTLPDGVLADDLTRVSVALAATGAQRLLVLGDLVHDVHGLTAAVQERVLSWRREIAIPTALVVGNHDRGADTWAPTWDIATYDAPLTIDPFAFSHEPMEVDGYNWCGHIHPAVTLHGASDRVRLPCFHV